MKAITKNILTIFLLITSLGVVSCGRDGDNNSELPLPTPTGNNREIEGFGKVADAIDLGLSVKWANWNLGALRIDDYGGLYGAGDPTGQKKSSSPSDYYFKDSESICGTTYDIASVKWGKPWRLPTYYELKELKDKCTWTYDVLIGNVLGCKATGPNGNTIFIPYSGHRIESTIYEREKHASIWSGEMGVAYHPNGYWDLDINKGGGFQMDGSDNYIGQSVRPVCEK